MNISVSIGPPLTGGSLEAEGEHAVLQRAGGSAILVDADSRRRLQRAWPTPTRGLP
jgi:hypothetical protein